MGSGIRGGEEKTTGRKEMIPGFFVSLAAVIAGSLLTNKPTEEAADMFEEMEQTHQEEHAQ